MNNGKRLGKGVFCICTLLCLTSWSVFSQTLESFGPIAEAKTKNAEKEILLRSDIVESAQEYLGTHYRSAGRSPSGFDCSGFVLYVMQEHEINMASSAASQERQGEKITKKEARPGDLVFFRRSPGGRVFHVSMVLENDNGNLMLIHSTSRGVVIDRLNESAYWRSKTMTLRNVVSGS
ncbi:MAG: C40 family peptidase [Bacteroidetes bacterium]|nr:C40 family peptidase [Bacteroidota bacterium]